jgi:hypothetical protein
MTDKKCILHEHNVILAKYGQDLYVDQVTITSKYPTEKGKKEKCLKLIGNLEGLMDSKNPDQHENILTIDGVKELKHYLELWLCERSEDGEVWQIPRRRMKF